MAFELMIVGGYLGTATVLILLGKTIETKPEKGGSNGGLEPTSDDLENMPNPFYLGVKLLLFAAAFLMIILNFFAMRTVVFHKAALNDTNMINNLTSMVGYGWTISVYTGLAVIGLLFIAFIAILFIWLKRTTDQVAKGKAGEKGELM